MPAPRHFHRTLTDIRAALDAGPEWYSGSEAAAALGLNLCTFNTWATEGRIPRKRSRPHGLGGRMWHYHRDALWRFVQDVYGYVPHDESEAARTAVLAMLERWQDCPTIQQLHDAAHVRPLPAYVTRPDYGHGSRPPLPDGYEFAQCDDCGEEYKRAEDADDSGLCGNCRRVLTRRRQRSMA